MDRNEFRPGAGQATFVAARPTSSATLSPRRAARGVAARYRTAPLRPIETPDWDSAAADRAFAMVIMTAVGLIVIPEMIHHLMNKHTPDLAIETAIAGQSFIGVLTKWGMSAVLLGVGTYVALRPGHPNRDITRLLVVLLAFNLPFIVGPERPPPGDMIKIVFTNVVIFAIWNTGAKVAVLKWLPILIAGVAAYSIIGGIIMPEYMMYNIVSRKALVAGWELAGPFGQSNALGTYCATAFALIPLISRQRWRLIAGAVLFAAVVASASRTSVMAVMFVILWWTICRFRSVVSIRVAGIALIALPISCVLTFPFLGWDPSAFTGRAFIWQQGLNLWRQSPVVGNGYDWFIAYGQSAAEIVLWASGGTGHNIMVDALVKYGLAGWLALVPVWVIAIVTTYRLRVPTQQVALFGYFINFFVMAITESVWDMRPNVQQFPISGLIFITLVLTRDNYRTRGEAFLPS